MKALGSNSLCFPGSLAASGGPVALTCKEQCLEIEIWMLRLLPDIGPSLATGVFLVPQRTFKMAYSLLGKWQNGEPL